MHVQHIKRVVKALKNWVAPGVDKIQNYWWKYTTTCHGTLEKQVKECFQDPDKTQAFFTVGLPTMIFQSGDPKNPQNFRPITCLPSIYKILTAVVTTKINSYLEGNGMLAWEQTGC